MIYFTSPVDIIGLHLSFLTGKTGLSFLSALPFEQLPCKTCALSSDGTPTGPSVDSSAYHGTLGLNTLIVWRVLVPVPILVVHREHQVPWWSPVQPFLRSKKGLRPGTKRTCYRGQQTCPGKLQQHVVSELPSDRHCKNHSVLLRFAWLYVACEYMCK
jgi:hypothetical protein